MSQRGRWKHVECIKPTSCISACPFVCAGLANVAETIRRQKECGLVYCTEKKKIKGTERLSGLCCWWERCVTCFRNHRAVGASMWLLSHWGNTDQVEQWAKAGVVKSSSEKKLHFTGRNKVSLCGLRPQAVSPLQMWAALWGPSLFLCKCERWFWPSILASIKAEQWRCRASSQIEKAILHAFRLRFVSRHGRFGDFSVSVTCWRSCFSARCRTISWSCTSRSTTACWSVSSRRSSSAYWPAGLRRKPRGSYHSSLVTRK